MGNFGVNETEYVANATLKTARPEQQLICSNVREIVEQQQYVLDTLWFRALGSLLQALWRKLEFFLSFSQLVYVSSLLHIGHNLGRRAAQN